MPNFIDTVAMKNGSTEVTVLSTSRVLQNVTMQSITIGTGTIQSLETLTASSGGVSPSTMVNYGISRITVATGDLSTSPRLAYLSAPAVGIEKTIVFETTAAYVNTLDVDLGADVGIDGSTSNRFIAFSTLATIPQSITLLGMTTAMWAVKGVNSTVGTWGAATGIRSGTAARTS